MNKIDCFHGKFVKLGVPEKKISCFHGKFLNLGVAERQARMNKLIVFTENS